MLFTRCIFPILTLLCLSVGNAFAQHGDKEKSKECQLTFGWDLVKPYQYLDKNNKVAGFQIELVEAIMKELGCEINYVNDEWNQLVEKLKVGEIDFMADMTVTEERKKYGTFSEGYRLESYTLYVRKADYNKYRAMSFTNMLRQGFKLGLTKGYVYNQMLENRRHSEEYAGQFSYVGNNSENYERLVAGEIDGFLEDSMVAGYTLRLKNIHSLVKGMPLEFYTGEISFLFSNKTVDLETIKKFNHAMETVKQSDEYKKTWLRELRN